MLIFGVDLLESDLVWGSQFRGFYSLKTHKEWTKKNPPIYSYIDLCLYCYYVKLNGRRRRFKSSTQAVAWPVSRGHSCQLNGTEHIVLPVLQRIPYASLCLRHTVMCSWHSTGRKVPIGVRQASRTWFILSVFKVLDFGCLSETTLFWPESKSVLLLLFFQYLSK